MMTPQADISATTDDGPDPHDDFMADLWDPFMVLVVDDSLMQRRLLSKAISKWGYKVIEAESGQEGLDLCAKHEFAIIVSDWMMPGMTGPQFCAEFREMGGPAYSYFILLTSKNSADEVAEGLNSGADDFLTKPVGLSELKARMKAGERIVQMQSQLVENNAKLNVALNAIETFYDSLNRDLKEAQKLQQSLVPERTVSLGQGQISMLLKPAGHIGGDLVGYFPINEAQIGLFSLDVSGHGISSALMTARLAGYLSGRNPRQNVALRRTAKDQYEARDPSETAERMNGVLLSELDTEHYFTLALSIIDLATGHMKSVQAGHPHPFLQREGQEPLTLGNGGLPVGLVPAAKFVTYETQLERGDRLVLYSDGITECVDPGGNMLDECGLADMLTELREQDSSSMLDELVERVWDFGGERDFDDDISMLVFDYLGPPNTVSKAKEPPEK